MSSAAAEAPTPEDPEDLKLITLARAALVRTGAPQGAAVRDTEGRAYAAASVGLKRLKLSAIAVAVAMAVSSGSGALEALALVGGEEPAAEDLEIARELAVDGAVLWWAGLDGNLRSVIEVR